MSSIGITLLVITVGVAAMASMRRSASIGSDFVLRSLAAVLSYAGAATLGLWVAWWMAVEWHAAVAAIVFLAGWAALVLSALVRYAPRLTTAPGAKARRVHAAVQAAAAMLAVAALVGAAA